MTASNESALTIGAPLKRLEDPGLLRGRGRYVDDIRLPDMVHAAFVRSPFAHAEIGAVDAAAARAVKGVLTVLTAADLAPHIAVDTLPTAAPDHPLQLQSGHMQVLARKEVRYVGEPVAVVVAESRYLAEDAASLVEIDYTPLPAVADCRDALAPDAPTAHSGAPDNVAARIHLEYGDCDKAFAEAPRAFTTSLWQHRGASHPMEGRGVVARHDPVQDETTVWCSTQVPHTMQQILTRLLGCDERRVRVIAPDVGGGFGPKIVTYPDESVVVAAARMLGRPIKWIEDRREHFIATAQERDQYWELEIAVTDDGRLIGVRGSAIHDHGAYSARGVNVPYNSGMVMPGPYVLPNFRLDITLAFTNKVPVASMRGAGHPQGVFAMERLMDLAADGIGMDRAEFRRRNLIPPDRIPYELPLKNRQGVGIVFDSGDYPACQEKAMALAEYAGFAQRKAKARAEGRYLGIGLANYLKGTGLGPFEAATVRVGPSGKVFIFTGATEQGQGTRMMLRQICAQNLGVRIEDIEVVGGDTATIPHGLGAYASRQTVLAGSAVKIAAEKVRNKALDIASHILESSAEDLEIVNGGIRVKGVPETSLTLAEVANAVAGAPGIPLPPGATPTLEASESFSVSTMTYANGVHVAEVEVDPETGGVEILRYIMVDDSGCRINPMIVGGQLVGGIVHGIGNALFEWMGYDETGQPVTTNLAEYLLPTAPELPLFELSDFETPSPRNPLGVKGVGESGTTGATAAVISAVEDALRPFGARIGIAPITPATLRALIEDGADEGTAMSNPTAQHANP